MPLSPAAASVPPHDVRRAWAAPLLLSLTLVLVPGPAAQAQPAPLRTAAQDNNTVKYNPKGDRKGLCVDVIRAIERVEPGLRFTGWDQPMSLPRIESALAEGRLDVFCALIRNAARDARFNFIEVPIYTVRHKIAVRADDPVNVRSLDDIRKLGHDNVVLVSKGTAHEELLRREHGLVLDASARDLDVNLRKLLHKRGRFFYHTENILLRYIEAENLGSQVRLLPTVFREDGMYFAVARTLPPATADLLRQALQQLAERGELKRIYTNYKED